MSNFVDRVGSLTESMISAMQAFWSAMLTAHTVLLSVAVAVPAISPSPDQWQIKFVGLLATTSIFALLFNFAALRMQLEVDRQLNSELELTEQVRQKDTSAVLREGLIRIFELLAAALLVVEAGLLMWVLFR